jgi:polysaccharide export outer membrane protein
MINASRVFLFVFVAVGMFAQAPPANPLRPNYTLGPNDEILIRVPNAEQLNEKPFRIDDDGTVNLPSVGRIRAQGLTIQELERAIAEKLKSELLNPQVTINVVKFRSDPVFLLGAFKSPGVYALTGRSTLLEMLAQVGGLQPNASQTLRITRKLAIGEIPLPNVTPDPDGESASVEINLGNLMQSVNPAEDIVLLAYDMVTAVRSGMIYVSGEVSRPGPVDVSDGDTAFITQVLSRAGGVTRYAAADKVVILRPVMQTSRKARIPVDLARILAGKAHDFPVLPNDLVVVPRSASVGNALKTSAMWVGPPIASALIFLLVR